MKVQACIFDLDGTLLDTLKDLANSVNEALACYHQPVHSIEDIRCYVGNGVRRLMHRALPKTISDDLFEEIFEKFLEIYAREKAHYTKPYDGILPLIQVLQDKEMRCAVLSNKNDDAVAALCEQYFPDCFEVVQGMQPGIAPKPAPDALLMICERMGISVEEAIYIGDSEVDVATARAADMRLIAVSWGFRSEETLREVGAKEIIHSPRELLEKL